jgi:hypothetical protein
MKDTNWVEDELSSVNIRDGRIVNRLIETTTILSEHPNVSIPEACEGWKETKATYRLLDNEKISYKTIIDAHRQQTIKRMRNKGIVLAIQDTTTIDYTGHPCTKGLGYTNLETLSGLMVHTTLAVETTGIPLGLLNQEIWTRDPAEKKERGKGRKLPTEEKESSKWLKALEVSLEGVPQNITVVTVCDREADIYDFFNKAVTEKKDFLIRAVQNRKILEEGKKLRDEVENAQIAGEVIIGVPRNTRDNIDPRDARVSIKYCPITINPPLKRSCDKSLNSLRLYCILAEEISPPEEVTPISWLLLTTIPIVTLGDAVEKIRWYSQRWKIERYHYVLKSGCNVEELQLETRSRLENALAIYSIIAWRLLWITYQSRETPNVNCEIVLEKHEWQSLYCMINKTPIPPENPPKLKDAVLMLARLGGFLGRKNDGEPGVKVIWRGLQRLKDVAQIWQIMNYQDLSIDMGNA